MKRALVMILVMALLAGVAGVPCTSAAQAAMIQMTIGSTKGYVNNKQVTLDQPPVIENGTTLVPFRFIGEAIGAKIDWNAATRTASFFYGNTGIHLTIGSTTAIVNGAAYTLMVAPKILPTGRTVVPVRFVSENMGGVVNWNSTTKMVTVTISTTPIYITIGTASAGGSFYPIGIKLAEIWNKTIPGIKAVAIATAGSPQNIDMMRTKDSEACVLRSLEGYRAIKGIESYVGKAAPWVVALSGPLYTSGTQVLAGTNAGIDSIADFRGKKVAVGAMGGAGVVDAKTVLAAYNLTLDDISPVYIDFAQAGDMLRDGTIAAAFSGLTLGSSSIAEVMLSGRVKLIPISDAAYAVLHKNDPTTARYIIRKGTYDNQNYDVPTFASPPMVIAGRKDLISDELAYQMTRAIYDNLPEFKTAASVMSAMTLQDAASDLLIPYHPGTLSYFKEAGIIK